MQSRDLIRTEAEVPQDLIRVFTQARRDSRRDLRRFFDRHGTVHGVSRRRAAVRDRNDDVVGQELRVLHDLFVDLGHAIGKPRGVERRLPMRERLRTERAFEFGDERRRVGAPALGVRKPRVGRQIGAVDRLREDRPVLIGLDECEEDPAAVRGLVGSAGEGIFRILSIQR
jgi:hypothetical protein